MDRDRISAITHGDRPFHNPLDPARIDEAIDRGYEWALIGFALIVLRRVDN